MRIPALGLDAPVVPVAMSAGGSAALVPPADPATLGWWTGGAAPGASGGTVLVTGHTVHSSEGVPGGGALDDLETVAPGDAVVVSTRAGRVRYQVQRVEVLSKAELAAAAYRLFGPTRTPRLVLVTCEDWDGAGYRSNVVVLATPVPAG
ncbi:MAG TPA: class F sortase [Nocardioidaceae bacterium]|jgi:sortase (surface protein transpeptidase)|nr:class F sortase [Nocardioidaceae bacterium]